MFDITYDDLFDGAFDDDELEDILINCESDKLGGELEGALCNVLNKHDDEGTDEVVVRPVREHKADEYVVRAM